MRKIKILRVIARLNIGGPAIHTVLLTAGLDKTRFDSLLICGAIGRGEGDMSYYAYQRNVKPIFIPQLKREMNFLSDISAFNKIYKIIKIERPDIIHTHTAKAGTLGRLAGILYNCFHPFSRKRIRLIHTFHGHIFDGYFGKIQTEFFILIERFLAVFTDQIITVSDSVKNGLIAMRICNARKIKIIPLGLELDKFLKLPVRETPVLNIGIVGRLVPIKNHRLFLQAAARLISGNPDTCLRFKIIGDGELKLDLQDYAQKLDIGKYVDFSGWQEELVSVYSGLDIVSLTSINEGTPVSLIEAMACAKAAVATDVGGVKDLLGEDNDAQMKHCFGFRVMERGILVSPDNADSFAAALEFISQDSALRKRMGEAARDFVKEKFIKERLIKDTENLYLRLLNVQ